MSIKHIQINASDAPERKLKFVPAEATPLDELVVDGEDWLGTLTEYSNGAFYFEAAEFWFQFEQWQLEQIVARLKTLNEDKANE